jgi:acetyl-CoA carboxylase carboxyl transferase subunit beta
MALENLFGLVKERWNGNGTDGSKQGKAPAAQKPQSAHSPQSSKVPEGILYKCPRCQSTVMSDVFERNLKVCPNCNYHGRMNADERLALVCDKGSFSELDATLSSLNPIDFPGYSEKTAELREKTGLEDSIITGTCEVRGIKTVIGVMDSRFMMASMGSVAGEKITRAFEYGLNQNLPVVMFICSGGARMQEGILSLMQMAKTSAAVSRFSEGGGLFVSVLTDPTTGGVEASFASLGDIIIAEPKVLIGFAGRRVIEGTIRQRLPDDFQSAEFQLEHGFVDLISDRRMMRRNIAHLLRLHSYT